MSHNNEFFTNIIILTLSITHNYADNSPNRSLARFARSPDGGCALPDDFPNGKYSLTGNYVPGKEINDGVFVTVECNGNYIPYPKYYSACSNNNWDPIFPKCVLTCSAISSESVQIDCEIFGTKISCNKPVPEGTIAHMKCRPFYQDLTSVNPLSQCKAGSWDIPIIKCAAECGNEIPTGTPLIINGIEAENGKFPWHVAIYRKKSSETDFKNICGGTIISEKVVLSAAHCFIDDRTKSFTNGSYIVGAGKYYSRFNSSMDVYRSQYIVAKDIKTPNEYKGFETNYQNDIALIILEKAFKITQFVRPICVDWHNQFEDLQLVENNIGIVIGWGLTKEHTSPASELKQLNVPYRSRFSCLKVVPEEFKRFVTTDKFCGGFTNGSAVCSGDSGGGLFFYLPNKSKYYIRGIVSISPRNMGTCDSHQYAAYTKISHDVIKWISSIETENRIHYYTSTTIAIGASPAGFSGCANIEIIPNGNYEIFQFVPGEVPNGKGTILKMQCNENYTVFPTAYTTCTENGWSPEIPKCIRSSCTLRSKNVPGKCVELKKCAHAIADMENKIDPQICSYIGTTPIVCCEENVKRPVGQISKDKCKEYGESVYRYVVKDSPPANESTCTIEQKSNAFPHMALLGYGEPNNIKYDCTGSLISDQYVLTAGHCLYSTIYDVKYVLLGDQNWEITTDVAHPKHFNVAEIIKHPDYIRQTFYNDIALLKLDRKIAKFNEFIRPACLHTTREIPKKRYLGTGWTISPTNYHLQRIVLDSVSNQYCNEPYKSVYARRIFKHGIVPETQICAIGTDSEIETCVGNTGGPLQIYSDVHCMYDVVGVASYKSCRHINASPGIYTRVSAYIEWIENTIWP